MYTVNISDFRANLLMYLEKANAGEQISVTTNGKILATISPPINKRLLAKQQLNKLAETVKIYDVVAPLESDWNALT